MTGEPRRAHARPRGGAGRSCGAAVGVSFAVMSLLIAAGCHPSAEPVAPSGPVAVPAAARVEFELRELGGEPVTSATTRGRALCVLFVTTYDLASQVEARRVDEVVVAYERRVSGLFVVLEEGQYAPLAAGFRDALALASPVAMADPATLAGEGPFGRIDRVPTLVVLDAEGRETSRRAGVLTRSDVEAALLSALGPPSARTP